MTPQRLSIRVTEGLLQRARASATHSSFHFGANRAGALHVEPEENPDMMLYPGQQG